MTGTGNNWHIRGGRLIDPANGVDSQADLLIIDGQVAAIGAIETPAGVSVIDAGGAIVAPGLVDLHVHLRTPGFEYKEDIATGTAAAAAGGFTAVCCMPNTKPALDSVEILNDLAAIVERDGRVAVYPIATITKGRAGAEAVDFDALAAAGAIGFSDDGDSTENSLIMRRALEASKRIKLPIMVHCEDRAIAKGAMNEGDVSRALGISGIPSEAEEIFIARDLLLAGLTGGWLHVCHVSTGRGADFVRQAKACGVNVTAEVMPHHMVMSDDWVAGSRHLLNVNEPDGEPGKPADPNTKVNPPLRPVADTRLLIDAVKDGTFDIIATDHAPHAEHEKAGASFEQASMGLSGSEFALPTTLALVRAGHLSLYRAVELLSTVPGQLLGKGGGTLSVGAQADVVIFDPSRKWVVTPESLKTKSKNTPLMGMELQGRVRQTLVGGEVRFDVSN